MTQITVLLADDHSVVREGLRTLLEAQDDFKVVAEAGDGLEVLELAQELRPDVIVLDLAMPKFNGMEAARQILKWPNPSKILILSAHGDDAYIEQVANLGVAGYLVKQTSAHMLTKAIRDVYRGQLVYGPRIAARLAEYRRGSPRAGSRRPAVPRLTPRERGVVQLIAEGRANKEVADDLAISVKTVEKHRQSAMRKLDIHDTAGLTRYAISSGIIENAVQCTIL